MDWFLSCVGHFVTFCWRHSTESQSVTAHEFHCGFEYRTILPGGTEGYPAQPGLIHPSVCLSVCLSVRPSVCPSVRESIDTSSSSVSTHVRYKTRRDACRDPTGDQDLTSVMVSSHKLQNRSQTDQSDGACRGVRMSVRGGTK